MALNLKSSEGELLLAILREMILKEGLFRKDTILRYLFEMNVEGTRFTLLERRKIDKVSDKEFLELFLQATGEEYDAVTKILEEIPKEERDAITKKLTGG